MTDSPDEHVAAVPPRFLLGERLVGARRRRMVGRAGEVELFRAALARSDESFRILYVYGPGGIGKTTLLGALADIATSAGATPIRVDARLTVPSTEALERAVASAAGRPEEPAAEAVAQTAHPVLLIDTAEVLTPLEDWLRTAFLPTLPADALVIIAGRTPPSPRWVTDAAWRDILRVVSLRNLPPADARAYLAAEDVPRELHERLLALSHGHPLTLALLVDGSRDPSTAPRSLADVPDLVGKLLANVVATAPTPRHRAALEVAAHARFTTESLLRAVLGGEDASELFDWLRSLSFVEIGRYGLFPHDLTRDVLDTDLRWRDPERYANLHRAVRDWLVGRIASAGDPTEKQRAVADTMFVARFHPGLSRYQEGLGGGREYIDELRPPDRAPVVEMTERHQGGEQARLVAYWLDRQPGAFRVFRGADGTPAGYAGYLSLHEATKDDLATDPGARSMWAYATSHSPPRPGEQVMAWRFFVDRVHHHEPSASLTLVAIWNVWEILSRERAAWDFVGTYTDAATWEPAMTYVDFGRAADADFEVGGRRYAVFAHDWRRVGVREWLELTAARELNAPVAAPHPHDTSDATGVVVLSHAEFADAVRTALRDLNDSRALAGNALLRSRLVHDQTGQGDRVDALRELFTEAAATLRGIPGGDELQQVLDRTFLRPAATQERVAEMLHLSFSTYRRRRDRAVELLTERLWRREVYGPDWLGHQMNTGRPGD